MAGNLRARLRRIREQRAGPVSSRGGPGQNADPRPLPGWTALGWGVCGRRVFRDLPSHPPFPCSRTLEILIPDLRGYTPGPVEAEDLLFFDLETTGLSHGAGTVAFLAACGRFEGDPEGGGLRLRIDQFLLLDYPGEENFLTAVLAEFQNPHTLVVSYNGKSFDSQILKTRCLMKGMSPPAYYHADLLHPARRLWKRALSRCAQAEIEGSVLGIDRSGDISGALAPELWFAFLKSADPRDLAGICEHNVKDIFGLSQLFIALAAIARSPQEAGEGYRVDREALAIRWRAAAGGAADPVAVQLMRNAAEGGMPRAAFLYGRDLLEAGRYEEGLRFLRESGGNAGAPPALRAAAYRAVAFDAERRQSDPRMALEAVDAALSLDGIPPRIRDPLVRRRERIREKIRRSGGEGAIEPPHRTAGPY